MRRFERLQLPHERIELGVRDFRRVVDVIQLFVPANPGSKYRGALSRRRHDAEKPATGGRG
jgi:hypothetical protein